MPNGLPTPRTMLRAGMRVMLVLVLGAGAPASTVISGSPSPEAMALNSVYFTALLSGRDPDAAVRKARFSMRVLMHDLGMTRSAAVADVTRFALGSGGVLCGGP